MNRRNVRDAYERVGLTTMEKEELLENILSAASNSEPAERNVTMKRWTKKTFMIAAVISLMVVLMGCAVVALKLNDLRIAQYDETQPAWIDADGEKFAATEVKRSEIAMQGTAEDNSQKAAQEWLEFTRSYDKDHKILMASDDFEAPAEYDAYNVYSQEMMDKVDEIAEKYGLKLAGRAVSVNDYAWDVVQEALGIDSPLRQNTQVEQTYRHCTFFESGNYGMSFVGTIADGAFPIEVTVFYHDKAYLSTSSISIKDADNAQQWTYTLKDGTPVLIVVVEDKNQSANNWAYIFCDREDAMLTVRMSYDYFPGDGTRKVMSREEIEQMVELVDFSVKPKKPDMAAVTKKLEAANSAYEKEMDSMVGNPFCKDSYSELAASLGSGIESFLLTDIDADGVEECLFKGTDGYSQLYTMQDGKTAPLELGGELFLCKDGVVESYEEVGQAYIIHGYYCLSGGKVTRLDRIVLNLADNTWARSNDGIVAQQSISSEQAKEIMDAYARIPMDLKPISDFPSDK